jgi:hypothetical protein
MKRWIILLGRLGTVFLAVGLALLLVSLIPSAQTNSFMGSTSVFQRTWAPWYYQGVLTPQQSLRFSVTANGSLNVYSLEVSSQTIYGWISDRHFDQIVYSTNITYFDEFLEANGESIRWQAQTQNGKVEYEYTPTKITNATLAISNPNYYSIDVEYEGSVTGQLAPIRKVRTLAEWSIPLGFVLALPWLTDLLRTKTKLRKS